MSMLSVLKPTILTAALMLFVLPTGCDSDGSTDPTTKCSLGFSVTNDTGKDFGEACTSNSECKYGGCLMPGATGNATNSVFGFCTRGCDCDNADGSALSPDEKNYLSCYYPQSPAQNYHHVVLQCSTVGDCTDLAASWTTCRLPEYGGARKICHAE